MGKPISAKDLTPEQVKKRARNERKRSRKALRAASAALVAKPAPRSQKLKKWHMEQIIMRATNENPFKIAREMNLQYRLVRSTLRRFRRGLHRGMPKLAVVG